jgi:hypothetical protein
MENEFCGLSTGGKAHCAETLKLLLLTLFFTLGSSNGVNFEISYKSSEVYKNGLNFEPF